MPASLPAAGINEISTFGAGTRLFLLIEAPDDVSPVAQAAADILAQGPRLAAMPDLLIVYHSLTGGSAQMARAAAAGAAREPGVRVAVLRAAETGPEHVLSSDAYLFVCPENLAAIAGMMKDFFDRTYYAALDRIQGRPYATMICAGSDGRNAAQQIERIATGWRLRAMAPPLIVCTHAQTPEAILGQKHIGAEDLARCGDLGATLSIGLAMGVF